MTPSTGPHQDDMREIRDTLQELSGLVNDVSRTTASNTLTLTQVGKDVALMRGDVTEVWTVISGPRAKPSDGLVARVEVLEADKDVRDGHLAWAKRSVIAGVVAVGAAAVSAIKAAAVWLFSGHQQSP